MSIPIPSTIPPAEELGRVHFVGIGGAGLSAIARIMLARGITVSGSDSASSATLDALGSLGARCFVGHQAAHIEQADTLVVSAAIREDNPEIVAAQQRGLLVLPRSAAMNSIMQGHRVLAVAGTHGKTTTTSLLTTALDACGADPTYTIGGDLSATGANAHQGGSDLFVAEADESDGAFLIYTPHAAVVTNVEADHLDNYGTEEAYRQAFESFLDNIEPDGFLVCCIDDPGAGSLAEEARRRGIEVIGVGEADGADLQAAELSFVGATSAFSVRRGTEVLGRVELQIPGRHYVLDALAALACGLRLGFNFESLARGLGSFSGTRRRMEFKGQVAGVKVYDSYAHHPTEIAGDLQAARSIAEAGRVVVAFQPHLVSRTQAFAVQMGEELSAADQVVVMDIYLAREEPVAGVSGALIADACPLAAEAKVFAPGREQVVAELLNRASEGDVILTLGAGDITELAQPILEGLRAGGRSTIDG